MGPWPKKLIDVTNLCLGTQGLKTHKFDVDILGENAPSDVQIHYNSGNITELLYNKASGHYLIFQGEENTIKIPYTIFVNKHSHSDGKIRTYFGHVGYDIETGNFIGGEATYNSFFDLVESHRNSLQYQIPGSFLF